jgi:AcrR family transcriptional regulator
MANPNDPDEPTRRPARRLTRRESQEQTRQRLLDMAVAVFAEKGFARTSVEEIAEQAGYSKGAVYSNFTSKEDLALAVLERQIEQQLAALTELLPVHGGDPAFWIAQGEAGAQGPWDALRMELWVRARYDAEVRARLAQQALRVREGAAMIMSRGAPPTNEQRDAVSLTVALATGLAIQHALTPVPHLMRHYAEFAVRLFNELTPTPSADPSNRPAPGAE